MNQKKRHTPRPNRRDSDKRGTGKTAAQSEDSDRSERIAKRIARCGLASRREAEALIQAGRVKVNGNVLTSPAFNVGPRDIILVDGQRLPDPERTRLFLFHKPAGTVTTNRDPEGRPTVFDTLPDGLPRLMTVGRLDYSTEGLLLLTNDGGLARVLELPSTGWLRRYRARVHGTIDESALDGLKQGIAVDGVLYGAIEATLERKQGSNAWLAVSLREGKNREIKKALGALGLEVTRLIRISYGPFQLGALPPSGVLELKGRTLRDQLGDRLIREAGADFDSEISKPFSNKPVRKSDPTPDTPKRDSRPRKSFREEGLDRLQTKPADGQEKERKSAPRSRASNVWMAPGARPKGGKKRKSGGDGRSADGDSAANPRRSKTRSGFKNADRRR